MDSIALEVKKIGRSWCVVVGKSVLGKFKTELIAKADLEDNRKMYAYWAGSASVSVENTPAKIVHLS